MNEACVMGCIGHVSARLPSVSRESKADILNESAYDSSDFQSRNRARVKSPIYNYYQSESR